MLNKAIEHGKEKRKPYRGAKSFDYSCRNHGSCSWCRDTRTAKNMQKERIAREKVEEGCDEK